MSYWPAAIVLFSALSTAQVERCAFGQTVTFADNAQHQALYLTPAQPLSRIRWSTLLDLRNTGAFAHYGAPLITVSNTVLIPVRTTNGGFQVSAFDGATGRLKYSLPTDYILPTYDWLPAYQPGMASPPSGLRLYFPGAGGTIYYAENIDSASPTELMHQCFYADLATYQSNATSFNATIFVNTPITADTNGVIFFGFRVQGSAPAPLNTTQSGFARIDPAGNATYVLASAAALDPNINRDSHNCAPALSKDGTTLYVAVKGANYAYLVGLDTATLTNRYRRLLMDPRVNSYAQVPDNGTASPMIAPDGEVFFGVLVNNGSRGYMLHFSPDLQTQKPPSAFGWDNTAAVVPASMVHSYTGASPYLLFTKYNNYAGNGDGDGINRMALLDPNATQTDPHPSASGLVEMREVLTVIGPTPDRGFFSATYPYAVREWCINTAAVNPPTASVFTPSEDGHIYRWDLTANILAETVALTPGVGEPYVPTVIGPDGTVFTLNGGTFFALGSLTNVSIAITSSAPDMRAVVTGEPLIFTALVTNLDSSGPAPTGDVTFQHLTYRGVTVVTNILAANVPLTNGMAAVTNSTFAAGGNYPTNFLGNHFVTARYSGDSNFPPGTATLVQKVHASATVTTLSSALASNHFVTLTASVTGGPVGVAKPTGMVSFMDGANFLAQAPLKTNGTVMVTLTNFTSGSHALNAIYASDTLFASSRGSVIPTAPYLSLAAFTTNGGFQLGFSNTIGAPFSVLGSTDVTLSLTNWDPLGPATEISPGQFLFTDDQAASMLQRFYIVRSP